MGQEQNNLRHTCMNELIQETVDAYYEAEQKRRNEWIEETLRGLIPEVLYLRWKSTENKDQLEDLMRTWLKEEGYRMEVSPDNILIQIWKGNEQVAQYQTILPEVVKTVEKEGAD